MAGTGVAFSVATVRAAMACHLLIVAGSSATRGVAWLGAATATEASTATVAAIATAMARLLGKGMRTSWTRKTRGGDREVVDLSGRKS